jgi:hypothetical protein
MCRSPRIDAAIAAEQYAATKGFSVRFGSGHGAQHVHPALPRGRPAMTAEAVDATLGELLGELLYSESLP